MSFVERDTLRLATLHPGRNLRVKVVLRNCEACVTLVGDDSPGEITLECDKYRVKESHGKLELKVLRMGGAGGRVSCLYSTKDGTAVA